MIGGTSTALVLLLGFLLLKEPFTRVRLLAVGLIVAGVFLLQRQGL
jgi:multidrug transporter EmrE-like cation transporter